MANQTTITISSWNRRSSMRSSYSWSSMVETTLKLKQRNTIRNLKHGLVVSVTAFNYHDQWSIIYGSLNCDSRVVLWGIFSCHYSSRVVNYYCRVFYKIDHGVKILTVLITFLFKRTNYKMTKKLKIFLSTSKNFHSDTNGHFWIYFTSLGYPTLPRMIQMRF